MASFPTPGDTFGDYRIERVIGRGGMGVVFAATQLRLNRLVALKVLPPDLAHDPAYRSRFLHECAALIRLDSPHVVTVYDAGESDGNLYLSMQLVSGHDLSVLLRSGPVPEARALGIAAQVAQALDDSHHVGVLHRDVKPNNVLLSTGRAGDDFVYLCDFGLARAAEDQTRTVMGVMGTPGYLAPERFEGGDASVTSDIYALGCLTWALLTGAPPYTGSQWQVANGHMTGPIPQLATFGAQHHAINELLRTSMAKSPHDRYTTAAQMRSAILAILAQPTDPLGQPTKAQFMSPPSPFAQPSQAGRWDDPQADRPGSAARGVIMAPAAPSPPTRRRSWVKPAAAAAAVALVASLVVVLVVLAGGSGSRSENPTGAKVGTGVTTSSGGSGDFGPVTPPEPPPRTNSVAQAALLAAMPTNVANCNAVLDTDQTRSGWASAEYLCSSGIGMSGLIAAKVDSALSSDMYVRQYLSAEPGRGTCPGDAPAKSSFVLSGIVMGPLYCVQTNDGLHVRYIWTEVTNGVIFVVEGVTASSATVHAFWAGLVYP